jgi:hypothetical protein
LCSGRSRTHDCLLVLLVWGCRCASTELEGNSLRIRAQVVATRDIDEGDELCISYGERSNTGFFLHYGFVPPRNPRDDVVLFESAEAALDWYVLESGLQLAAAREDEATLVAKLQRIGARDGPSHDRHGSVAWQLHAGV